MKRYLLLIAAFFGILMALPQTAEAGTYRRGYVRVYSGGRYYYRPYRYRTYYRPTYYRPYYGYQRPYYYNPYYANGYYPYHRPGVTFSFGY